MTLPDRLALMEAAVVASLQITRLWGSGLGLHLVRRFYGDDPWTTVAELAADSGMSEDTVRRKLEELASIGRVRVARRGRATVYKARRDLAHRTYNSVKSLLSTAKCGDG